MMAFLFAKLPILYFACALPSGNFLGIFPPWWEFMAGTKDPLGQCTPSLTIAGQFQLSSIWLIGLAVIDILLRLAGLVAVISIMVAGAQYQFTGGNPEKAASARRRLYNSLIGLGIAIIATATVTFIGNQLAST